MAIKDRGKSLNRKLDRGGNISGATMLVGGMLGGFSQTLNGNVDGGIKMLFGGIAGGIFAPAVFNMFKKQELATASPELVAMSKKSPQLNKHMQGLIAAVSARDKLLKLLDEDKDIDERKFKELTKQIKSSGKAAKTPFMKEARDMKMDNSDIKAFKAIFDSAVKGSLTFLEVRG